MSDGGIIVKFEGAKEKPKRCYAVTFDYDEWFYTINNKSKHDLPLGTKRIIVEVKQA